MNIHNYLPNGKRDIEDGGCKDEGCSGSGFAFLVGGPFKENGEVFCKTHFKDLQNSGEIEKAEKVFTVDE